MLVNKGKHLSFRKKKKKKKKKNQTYQPTNKQKMWIIYLARFEIHLYES
jgi:hypothetical protein